MFICPYVLKKEKSIWTAWIFLTDGGKTLWKTDEETLNTQEILDQYLIPNGFHGTVKCVKDTILYYEVNAECMDTFYTWHDYLKTGILPSQDIWRPFLLYTEDPEAWMAEIHSKTDLLFLEDFWGFVKTPKL